MRQAKVGRMIHDAQATTAEASARILIVEDDETIYRMLGDVLRENGFAVSTAASGPEMDSALQRQNVDLIVLDVMLPGEDGFSICGRLRALSNIPIIMLTALGQDVDRIVGLEIGADDYVNKPFNSRELVARIRAVLRRVRVSGGQGRQRAGPRRFAGWRIYPTERRLLNPEGVSVTTTSAEFDLLLAFSQHPGEVLSREQLLELTYGGLAGPVDRSVDVHVSRIRQKIEPDPRDPSLIKTVRLGGYIFSFSSHRAGDDRRTNHGPRRCGRSAGRWACLRSAFLLGVPGRSQTGDPCECQGGPHRHNRQGGRGVQNSG